MSETTFKIGDKAPTFTLKAHNGKQFDMADYFGKQPVVLIFYPGDMTPGCTIQLCNIRDDWSKFEQAGITVFGVNHADADSHGKFVTKYNFPFPLLIDTDKKVSKKYGAIKKLFSATVIKRTVAAIGLDGTIKFYRHGMPKDTEILKTINK
ncbi:MAG: peroxiredoxin [Patescibacteria group bacterium]|jgi:peroxiredoxin Q/BCP